MDKATRLQVAEQLGFRTPRARLASWLDAYRKDPESAKISGSGYELLADDLEAVLSERSQ